MGLGTKDGTDGTGVLLRDFRTQLRRETSRGIVNIIFIITSINVIILITTMKITGLGFRV